MSSRPGAESEQLRRADFSSAREKGRLYSSELSEEKLHGRFSFSCFCFKKEADLVSEEDFFSIVEAIRFATTCLSVTRVSFSLRW